MKIQKEFRNPKLKIHQRVSSPPPPAPPFSADADDHPWAASESLRISLSRQGGKREEASEFKEPEPEPEPETGTGSNRGSNEN